MTMDLTLVGKAVRLRQERDSEGKPKKYKHSYRITPEDTDETLFSCDVIAHVASREVVFVDASGKPSFSMRPNRRIMPMYWPVTDALGREIGQIRQNILKGGKWSGLDPSGSEIFRIADAESRSTKVGNAVFGGGSSKYGIYRGEVLLARTETKPRHKITRGGIRGFLQTFVSPHDWVVSFESDAADIDLRLILPAMILLIDITVALDSAD